MKNKIIWSVGIILAILVAGFFYNKYRIAPSVKFDTLELTDLSGNKVTIEKFKGKKLFINFFATWCGPCMGEMASIENAQQILSNDNFQFIMISDESTERLRAFQRQISIPVLHSAKKLSSFDIVTIPTTYLLNEKQEVEFKKTGEADWASEENIKELKAGSLY